MTINQFNFKLIFKLNLLMLAILDKYDPFRLGSVPKYKAIVMKILYVGII